MLYRISVLFCIGTGSHIESDHNDRTDLTLPGHQLQLLQDTLAAGIKILKDCGQFLVHMYILHCGRHFLSVWTLPKFRLDIDSSLKKYFETSPQV